MAGGMDGNERADSCYAVCCTFSEDPSQHTDRVLVACDGYNGGVLFFHSSIERSISQPFSAPFGI